jgi:hypothetical protein
MALSLFIEISKVAVWMGFKQPRAELHSALFVKKEMNPQGF